MSGHRAVPDERPDVSIRPRWLWIAFTLVAIAIPLIGLWLERSR